VKLKFLCLGVVLLLATGLAWGAYNGGWTNPGTVTGAGTVQACACKKVVATEGGTSYYQVNFAAKTAGNGAGWRIGLSGSSGRRGLYGHKPLEEDNEGDYQAEGEALGTAVSHLTGTVRVRLRIWKVGDNNAPTTLIGPMAVEDLPDCEGENGKPCPPAGN